MATHRHRNFEEKIGANWENITIISILHMFFAMKYSDARLFVLHFCLDGCERQIASCSSFMRSKWQGRSCHDAFSPARAAPSDDFWGDKACRWLPMIQPWVARQHLVGKALGFGLWGVLFWFERSRCTLLTQRRLQQLEIPLSPTLAQCVLAIRLVCGNFWTSADPSSLQEVWQCGSVTFFSAWEKTKFILFCNCSSV